MRSRVLDAAHAVRDQLPNLQAESSCGRLSNVLHLNGMLRHSAVLCDSRILCMSRNATYKRISIEAVSSSYSVHEEKTCLKRLCFLPLK